MSPEELIISKLDKELSQLHKGMHTAGPQFITIDEITATMIRERLKQQKKLIERYEEALRFYAEGNNYDYGENDEEIVLLDLGAFAQLALNGEK